MIDQEPAGRLVDMFTMDAKGKGALLDLTSVSGQNGVYGMLHVRKMLRTRNGIRRNSRDAWKSLRMNVAAMLSRDCQMASLVSLQLSVNTAPRHQGGHIVSAILALPSKRACILEEQPPQHYPQSQSLIPWMQCMPLVYHSMANQWNLFKLISPTE
jgi:hypothetical protein